MHQRHYGERNRHCHKREMFPRHRNIIYKFRRDSHVCQACHVSGLTLALHQATNAKIAIGTVVKIPDDTAAMSFIRLEVTMSSEPASGCYRRLATSNCRVLPRHTSTANSIAYTKELFMSTKKRIAKTEGNGPCRDGWIDDNGLTAQEQFPTCGHLL